VKEATVAEPFTRDYRKFRPEHLPEIRAIPGRQSATPFTFRNDPPGSKNKHKSCQSRFQPFWLLSSFIVALLLL